MEDLRVVQGLEADVTGGVDHCAAHVEVPSRAEACGTGRTGRRRVQGQTGTVRLPRLQGRAESTTPSR
jgi:hypothetical protein